MVSRSRNALGVIQQMLCGQVRISKHHVVRAPAAHLLKVNRLELDAGFEPDVGGRVPICKESPPGRFKQLVDLDAGSGFFVWQSRSLRRCWTGHGRIDSLSRTDDLIVIEIARKLARLPYQQGEGVGELEHADTRNSLIVEMPEMGTITSDEGICLAGDCGSQNRSILGRQSELDRLRSQIG